MTRTSFNKWKLAAPFVQKKKENTTKNLSNTPLQRETFSNENLSSQEGFER